MSAGINERVFSAKAKEEYEALEHFDIANLLNEEVEKSRNLFFLSTFLSLALMTFEVKEFSFLGVKATLRPEVAFRTLILLTVISTFLGIYYLINAHSNYISKLSKRALIDQRLTLFSSELEKANAAIEKAKEQKVSIKPVRANAKTKLEKVYNEANTVFSKFQKNLDRQLKILIILPFLSFAICISFLVVTLHHIKNESSNNVISTTIQASGEK